VTQRENSGTTEYGSQQSHIKVHGCVECVRVDAQNCTSLSPDYKYLKDATFWTGPKIYWTHSQVHSHNMQKCR